MFNPLDDASDPAKRIGYKPPVAPAKVGVPQVKPAPPLSAAVDTHALAHAATPPAPAPGIPAAPYPAAGVGLPSASAVPAVGHVGVAAPKPGPFAGGPAGEVPGSAQMWNRMYKQDADWEKAQGPNIGYNTPGHPHFARDEAASNIIQPRPEGEIPGSPEMWARTNAEDKAWEAVHEPRRFPDGSQSHHLTAYGWNMLHPDQKVLETSDGRGYGGIQQAAPQAQRAMTPMELMQHTNEGYANLLASGGLDPHSYAAVLHAQGNLFGAMNQHAGMLGDQQAAMRGDAIKREELAIRKEQGDPNAQVSLMEAMMKNPSARQGYFAGKGLPDPGQPSDPSQPLDANSAAIALHNPQNAGLADIFGQADLPLHDKMQLASQVNGMSDPKSQSHQILQNYINQSYSTNPAKWSEDTYVPDDPNASVLPSVLSRPIGVANAMLGAINPFTEHSQGTGFGWPEFHRKRQRQAELFKQIGIQPPPGFKFPE